ncbi:DUF2970 domain-containing protein [Variovorax sp. dw_308]|uniref:DUF2970 domain-containing protein n=1 Tax=Variovorax sp. dw_308 TaxID=2721546 RepID=UPI003527357D
MSRDMRGSQRHGKLIRTIRLDLHLFFCRQARDIQSMSILPRSVRAVLWSFIGLGGRRADADARTEDVGILSLVCVALVLVLLLVGGLIAVARFAATA